MDTQQLVPVDTPPTYGYNTGYGDVPTDGTIDCLEGYYFDGTSCVECPAGHFCTGGIAATGVGRAVKTPCSYGTKPNSNKDACENCPAGTVGTGENCNTCGRGKYQDQREQSECKNCPAGRGGGQSSGRASLSYCHSSDSNQVSAVGQACQTCTHGKHPDRERC